MVCSVAACRAMENALGLPSLPGALIVARRQQIINHLGAALQIANGADDWCPILAATGQFVLVSHLSCFLPSRMRNSHFYRQSMRSTYWALPLTILQKATSTSTH